MNPSRRIRLVIAFDGGGYHGWQAGRSGHGVADVLQAVLGLLGAGDDLVSSSRTDSGVHAHGMVAHADLTGPWIKRDGGEVRDFLNAKLPPDIRVRAAVWSPSRFHARFDARWKEYRYSVCNDPVMDPLLVGRAWHVAKPLDLRKMRAAARLLVGRHDFHAFTSKRDGTLGDPIREMIKLSVSKTGSEVRFTLRASGFLYRMCRGIAGTLAEAGRGKLEPDQIRALLEPDSPRTPAMNAPAHGLVLWKVGYRRNGHFPEPGEWPDQSAVAFARSERNGRISREKKQ